MAFDPNKLDADFKTKEELDRLAEIGTESVKDALHQNQPDDLSKETSSNVKLFFDYMALHVLIPCINALNRAVLALKGNTSTSLEKLEKKLTALSGDTTTSVKALEERVDTVEKVSAVSTAKVEAATELAKAAAENVMQKDQCASVMDLITGQPLYFGRGSEEEVDASMLAAPGEAVYFQEDDVDYEALVKHPKNTENPHGVTYEQVGAAPNGLISEVLKVSNDIELDEKLKAFYASMPNNVMGHIVIMDYTGKTFFGGGNNQTTIYKTSDDYGAVETAVYSTYGRVFRCERTIYQGIWSDWAYENPAMNLGVEYRTTERHNGHIVYKKLLNYNASNIGDDNTITNIKVPTGIAGPFTGIRCHCSTPSGHLLPYIAENGGITSVNKINSKDQINLRISNDSWESGNFYFDLAYVKE